MENEQNFKMLIKEKKIPIVVLDQKWHRLFAIHGKPQEVKDREAELNGLLARQGKLNDELKNLKKVKNQLMDSIMQNMEEVGEQGGSRQKTMEENRRLIDEANEKIDANEDELLEIPKRIVTVNEELMLLSMYYFYEKIRINQEESKEIGDWIAQVRVDLKKNIIRKQNRDINNREMYAYLHDIFGPEALDLFDIRYEDNQNEEEEEKN